ncbi:hypothetical protein [Burkholderia lata]|uniref:hypothetical protein n=1 Tax=Burkholderia lata (strain ATCC 17760 / DSM 23089 / LMG 22485 / NCIMB 9086 / R18194 / 383) TaxID=482957 RepID=UPI0012EA4236|nr:hypothetical protein [Burkholderia lata]
MHRAPVLEWLLAAFLRVAGPVRIIRRKLLYGDAQAHRYADLAPRHDGQPIGVMPGMAGFDQRFGKGAERCRRRALKSARPPVSMRAEL